MARKKRTRSKKSTPYETGENNISSVTEERPVTDNGRFKSFTGNRILVSVFLFLVSFAVFIPSLGNDFVWDDVSYIQRKAKNLNFSKIGPELISPKLKEGKTAGKYFRPLYQVSLIVDNEMWNTSPFGFHLTNIILHSISTVLLYFLVLVLLGEFNIRGREAIALIASVLFALYPLHVESVSFVSARGDILAAIFFFLSLIFYIFSYKRMFYLILAVFCFLLSFLSKEVAIALPIVIVCYDLLSRRLKSRENLIKYMALGLIAFLYFLIRSRSYQSFTGIVESSNSEISEGFFHVADLFLNTYLFYIVKMVFPYNLKPFIDHVPEWGLLGLAASIILAAVLCIAVFVSVKKRENLTAFSILWILVTLLPAAAVAILPIAFTSHAERFLYIPSVGVCILFAYIIYELSGRFNMKMLSLILTLVLSVSFAAVTLSEQKVWKNNLSLWESAVLKSPDSPAARINYGDALRNSGKPLEALENYMYAYENGTEFNNKAKATTAHGIVVSYIDLSNYQQAEKWLETVLNEYPKYLPRYYYMKGFIALRKNNSAQAESYLLKSLDELPMANTYYLLGGISFMKAEQNNSPQQYSQAKDYLTKTVELKPDFAKAYLLLAKANLALGDSESANANANMALKYSTEQQVADEARSILQDN